MVEVLMSTPSSTLSFHLIEVPAQLVLYFQFREAACSSFCSFCFSRHQPSRVWVIITPVLASQVRGSLFIFYKIPGLDKSCGILQTSSKKSFFPFFLSIGAPPPPDHAINRGIGTEGLGCILGDLLGVATFDDHIFVISCVKKVLSSSCNS